MLSRDHFLSFLLATFFLRSCISKPGSSPNGNTDVISIVDPCDTDLDGSISYAEAETCLNSRQDIVVAVQNLYSLPWSIQECLEFAKTHLDQGFNLCDENMDGDLDKEEQNTC